MNWVNSKEIFDRLAGNDQKPTIDIALGIDQNYARCMGVLIASILSANPELAFVFHVFTDSILPEDRVRIARLAEQYPVSIQIYYINPEAVKSFPASSHYSSAVYYRILMPQILHGQVSRVLYLDSDIICIGSLAQLSQIDLADKTVAAVRDVARVAAEKMQELQLGNDCYFNSGVMIIDVERWNSRSMTPKVLSVLSDNKGSFSLVDQDALNIVFNDDVSILPPVWNQIYDLGQMTHDPIPGTIFLHYTGSVKPWRLSGRHRLSSHYRTQEAQSPWAGSPLLPPKNYKEMEIYARLSLKDGDFITGFRWYFRYLVSKFCKL